MSGDIGEKLNQLRQLYGLVDHSITETLDGLRKQIDATRNGTKRLPAEIVDRINARFLQLRYACGPDLQSLEEALDGAIDRRKR